MADLALRSIASHCAASLATSWESSSSAGPLGRGTHDHARVLRHHLLQDLLEPGALGVGQLAADPGHGRAGNVDQVPAGQAHLAGQPGALVPDRVLGRLDQNRLAGLERRLDPLGLALESAGVEVDLSGVQDRVPALADVDERRLHGGQHVLHPAEIDVAHVGLVAGLVHVVLDQDPVLEHGDLGPVAALPDHHDPLDGLAPGQELRLGDDRRPAPAGFAALAPPLPLGLEPRGALDALDVGAVIPGCARGARTWTTVFGGSSDAGASPSPEWPLRRRRRRRLARSPARRSPHPRRRRPRQSRWRPPRPLPVRTRRACRRRRPLRQRACSAASSPRGPCRGRHGACAGWTNRPPRRRHPARQRRRAAPPRRVRFAVAGLLACARPRR